MSQLYGEGSPSGHLWLLSDLSQWASLVLILIFNNTKPIWPLHLCLNTLLPYFYDHILLRRPLFFSGNSFSFFFADSVFSTQSLNVEYLSKHTSFGPFLLSLCTLPVQFCLSYGLIFVTFTYKPLVQASQLQVDIYNSHCLHLCVPEISPGCSPPIVSSSTALKPEPESHPWLSPSFSIANTGLGFVDLPL